MRAPDGDRERLVVSEATPSEATPSEAKPSAVLSATAMPRRSSRTRRLRAFASSVTCVAMLAVILTARDAHDQCCPQRFVFFPPSSPPPPPPHFVPLREAAPDWLLIGTAYNDVRLWGLNDTAEEEAYERRIAETFSVVTPENACKPFMIMPTRDGLPNWSSCDRVLAFARAHGLQFRLHVLAWNEWNPPWMEQLRADEREDALLSYTRMVLERYAGQVDIIDVVNEAVCDQILMTKAKQNCGSGPGFLKGGQWIPSVPDYLDKVFHLARELCAHCTLVLNEYGHESDGDVIDAMKHERVFATVSAALARGVPIDAVGFQFHVSELHSGNGFLGLPFSGWLPGVRRVFERFAQLGVALHVTEIDVGCHLPTLPCTLWESDAAREEGQAQVYAGVLSACIEMRGACSVFQTWGHTDKLSWRDGHWEAGAMTPSKNMDQRAHIFAKDGSPKCAYFAMLDVLQRARRQGAHA